MFSKKIQPEKLVGAYLASKQYEKFPRLHYESLQPPAVEVEQDRRVLMITEDRLEQKRIYFRTKMDDFKNQWDELKIKEELLQQNFIKMNKFVRENWEKRVRAEENMEETTKNLEGKIEECTSLREKLEEIVIVKRDLDEMIRKYSIYENFLNEMVNHSFGFKNIDEIVNRYETYMEAKAEVGMRQEASLVELENARTQMMKLIECGQLKMVGLYNTLSLHTGRYEEAAAKSRKWELLVVEIRNRIIQRVGEIEMVKLSIQTHYQMICKRKNIMPKYRPEEIEQQLMTIKKTLQELATVNAIMRRKLKAQQKVNKARNSS